MQLEINCCIDLSVFFFVHVYEKNGTYFQLSADMENSKYHLSAITDFVILLQPLTVRVKLLKTSC